MWDKNKTVNVYIPFHIGSGNRGCEAITRATAEILRLGKHSIHVLTNDKKEDIKVGLAKVVSLQECCWNIKTPFFEKCINYINEMLKKDIRMMFRYFKFLEKAHFGDVVLITGGDLYCYPNMVWELRWVCWLARQKGCTTILWGCSIDKQRLNENMVHHLKKYDRIYARESCTKKNLENMGVRRVRQLPDSAFRLEATPFQMLKELKQGKIIGINISNFTNQCSYSVNTIFYKNILNLISYILKESEYQVLLIPHVFWEGQDDRVLLQKLYQKFKESKRVYFLESNKLSYCQIRYAISQCHLFIGSRTHSVISAYAMGLPTLALGYSIKSKGIALDLGLPMELLVDCNHLKSEVEILTRYLFLEENYISIKEGLADKIRRYSI